MITSYTPFELLLYLFLYAALGWALEVSLFALRDRRFINRGFLTLPSFSFWRCPRWNTTSRCSI